ncbi:MAG: VOC family protein [Fusobacteriaceae bacterium]|jgi:kynurenine formamidase/catechol 2,3-dioxygenase-like lactoylglutathione lyase family enzyme|nr:VOC family protein [Fusobacteriaceae bacterium]
MLIDLSVNVNREMIQNMKSYAAKEEAFSVLDLFGHLGTHFDVQDKVFDLENLRRKGRVFDVSAVTEGEIKASNIDLTLVEAKDFVMFYTGTLQKKQYGSKEYFSSHPELSWDLITALTEKGVSMIGIDAGGIRLPATHSKADYYCADRNVFVVENLDNLEKILQTVGSGAPFTAETYPLSFTGATGLPCRVIARIEETSAIKMAHIALYVKDLEAGKKFYETYFQAQASSKYHNPKTTFQSYFLTFGKGAGIELCTRENLSPRASGEYPPGFAHISLSVGDKNAVDALTERLRKDGYAIASEPRTTGDGYYESVVLDPEGNPVEITV